MLTEKRILDDTSIAALALPNGDRRVFFQDLSGVIRQAFFSATTGEWRADVNYLVASDAKNHTPIAVVNVPAANLSMNNAAINVGASAVVGQSVSPHDAL